MNETPGIDQETTFLASGEGGPQHHPGWGEPTVQAPYPPVPPQMTMPPTTYMSPPPTEMAPPAYPAPYSPPPAGMPSSGMPVPYSPYAVAPAAHPMSPYPHPAASLVSPGGRLGAVLLDALIIMVTFGIGWLIWSVFTWSDGQTPGKKLLGHVVIDAQTGAPFDWGRMALREFGIKGVLGWILNIFTLGVYSLVDALMVFGDCQRTAHDRMANSLVRHL
jgi:uncharacterized RDD family membrane protein YckC